jgi:signal peptidase II
LFLGVCLFALAADLLSKHYAFEHVAGQPVRYAGDGTGRSCWNMPWRGSPLVIVVPKVLGLQLVVNHGAVFGMFQGQRWFFMLASILAVLVIGRMFWRSPARAPALHVGLALILAGALGNLYDRVRFASVRDMCHLFPGVNLPFGWSWTAETHEVYPWVFNVADVALLGGVVTLAVLMWRSGRSQTGGASSGGGGSKPPQSAR